MQNVEHIVKSFLSHALKLCHVFVYVLTFFAGGSHEHLCDVTEVDLCRILLAATRVEIMAAI